ncbi:multidrug ABC transporter ATP-binding protein [candidate division CPR3 bacterium GWF2_35_18]|uniref:ABC transporter domain-containing protein n=1 Tax=candidate division CPR3 bacterium GW2011_GWF2_35_18 TaxID=1618350 RepID=A0A0G0BZV5_UNCC3|nr:MAG: hypothetical protein UR67_C0007G0086 [candidate division CPR3 bacterium GW2011_GWF2_35_18]OGB62609.1 MAG: multidrug ABC transporter ATP-binding protein [candidate division CPR3 bacterium GWF2_35_18]OGB65860.1 MAG: multidrug ABC transporter ATP-binding protein [candidate division CPR3 bacterium RIFOXYA2_FULL_35_13]OGB76677.1 MAG: multidrug ABC transporter ATP-binding protein [candidate division CPR3 bacterium RIFOXYC2_FULL_35_7]OGB78835.1 MAG: multidrug ABC transporter ATP-binding protei
MENALTVRNLTKKYGNVEAVSDISFTVRPHEIFALIGPNGAGKSTTLKIIATLLSPTSGEVFIYGLDVVKEASRVRELISYLPEDSGAYKNLTGMQYLQFMAGLYSDNVKKMKDYVELGKEISGLDLRLKDKTSTYSKGMTRKLLIGRTVMVSPKLAILDEPTSGLDVVNAIEIRDKVKEMTNHGTTVLLSSHNMLEIEMLSDRVAIIDKGKIHEIGTPQDLKEKYKAENLEEVFVKATKK